METNKLYTIAADKGITVDFFPLPQNKSVCISTREREYVALDPQVFGCQERVCLAHELGHCATAGFYNMYSPLDIREKYEKRAWSWAIRFLVPLKELEKAQKNGMNDIDELAEHFAVTREFMKRVMDYYIQNQ